MVQTAADGSATIQTQEALLDTAYFSANGQLAGLEVTVAGLSLVAGANDGSYTSGVVRSPLAFTTDIAPLWSADLPSGATLRLETRLSLDSGASWSDWVENPEAFYPVRDNLYGGNLIWVESPQSALQFRVTLHRDGSHLTPLLRSLTLIFSDTSQGPTDGQIAGQMAAASATTGQVCPVTKPAVVSRTQWGCPNTPRFNWPTPPRYAPVTHIIIHQTETPNQPHPYSGYAGWVRSIWNFHANILRWGDVGYNYLIDPNGVIYEGRAGGDDVIGFHDGLNSGSMGIGFIGCYGNCDDRRLSVAEPSQTMLDAAVNLMAWKAGQHGLNPLGGATYNGRPNTPIIAGGRDVAMTTSPGDNLYNKLDQLRQRVSDKLNCPKTCQIASVIFGKENYKTGETISFTVRLADFQGTPLPGAVVTATRIISQVAGIQASTGFGFIDRAGEYDGKDSDTQLPGIYKYTFTATDPSGQKFKPCLATATVNVTGTVPPTVTITPTATATTTVTPTTTVTSTPPTLTPTPTNTPTPTSTPTPIPTTPAGPTIRINPTNLNLPVCSGPGSASVEVLNVSNMIAAQLELRYNPSLAQVNDADPGRDGVQIRVANIFSNGFIAQNTVHTTTGVISFAATLLGGNPISGTANLISVDWQPVAAGEANLTLENVILVNKAGESFTFTSQNGQMKVTNCTGVSGSVTLQGRTNYSGVIVTSSTGEQAQTAADGSFNLASAGQLTFNYPGYLSAQSNPPAQLAQSGNTTLAALILLAGDINADSRIDILDLAYIAKFYNSGDILADLNGDGIVNIMDLVLAAGNYGQRGPLVN
jgi:hypothetical protein